MSTLQQLLEKPGLDHVDLVALLSIISEEDTQAILEKAYQIKTTGVGRKVYLRGLIELTNECAKNCFYCGIRAANHKTERYTLSEEEMLTAAQFAHANGFGSLVIQTGELTGNSFASLIENLLLKIHQRTQNELTLTLSCGEQKAGVYRRWKKAGASRYLLRVESTNRNLYESIHPKNKQHSFDKRMEALWLLQQEGFQVGTGVMIGLPGQNLHDLANDLLFFKSFSIDMVGMGPYIEHADTPLFQHKDLLWPAAERFRLSLLMIALARILMPEINIAASTALETLHSAGRQKGIMAGANIVMPNLTPVDSRKKYLLYNNKPNLAKDAALSASSLNEAITALGEEIGFNQAGNSAHFLRRRKNSFLS